MKRFLFFLLTALLFIGFSSFDSVAQTWEDWWEAMDALERKAKNGDVEAQLDAAYAYLDIEDYEAAVSWFERAAQQENLEAVYSLGLCWYKGWGVEQSDYAALLLIELAANNGYADAQHCMGCFYYNGDVCLVEDHATAVKWFKKAAEQGHAIAQTDLGECYFDGDGVKQDYAEAIKWYRKAAEQGDLDGQFLLAECYASGKGVKKDYSEAAKWYRKAAENNDGASPEAEYILATYYAEGKGVPQDDSEALKWARFASAYNYEPALKLLEELQKRITPAKTVETKSFAEISVRSTPSSAQVWIDGENTGEVTPCLINNLNPGSHTIKLETSYHSFEGNFVADVTEQKTLNYKLSQKGIDLGLPSGIKWAPFNIGASAPNEFGHYFAWGEISPKDDYSWDTYRFMWYDSRHKAGAFSKYNTDKKRGEADSILRLEPEDDASNVYLRDGWRMPTSENFEELKQCCTREWATVGGVQGVRFTSRTNGNSIFLPAGGNKYKTKTVETNHYGEYWTASLDAGNPENGRYLVFSSAFFDTNSTAARYYGMLIRPVK